MLKDDKSIELQRERDYLFSRLEDVSKELARLDILNLNLNQQKRQAFASFDLIKNICEEIDEASTIEKLFFKAIKALTCNLSMDSSALLKINFYTKDIFIMSSSGLSGNTKFLKLNKDISKEEILEPTFVNSKSSLKSFHRFVIEAFKFPFFIWYPFKDEDNLILVLFVGNRFEDQFSRQPFSEISLKTLEAISSVILLKRDSILRTQEMLRRKEERIDFLADILKTSPISVIAADWNGEITYVNPATEKLFGYEREYVIGRDLNIIIAESTDFDVRKEVLNTIRDGKVWKKELLGKKKNGTIFNIHSSFYQLLDREGNFISFVGFLRDITERKNAEREREYLLEQLRISQNHLQSILRRLVEVQESDHRFLASELHDQVGQNLTALSINLNIIRSLFPDTSDKKFISRIEDSQKLVEETMERVRDIMAGLRPPVLEDYGLSVAIRWFSERFSERTGISIMFQEDGNSSRLPLAVEAALFRIFQEVLTNIAKHAQAKNVEIALKEIDGVIQLSITDDGIGFDPTEIQIKKIPKWGLISIEERAKALGGDLYIKSVAGKGTTIIVCIKR